MPTVQVPSQLTIEHLLAAVKQLSSTELREFVRQFTEWQRQNGGQEEGALLARIVENSHLPTVEQRRFNRLRRKHQAEMLTKAEEAELQTFWRRVEQMNVTRLEALAKLAQRRDTDVRTLMRELGLAENRDVF